MNEFREPRVPGVGQAAMRKIRGLFASGVTVATTALEGRFHGMTVSAFSPVSLDPPLILACIAHEAATGEMIVASGVFAVSLLSDEQEFLSERFAARAPLVNEDFEGVPYRVAVTGAPILEKSLAWYDCRLETICHGGDHKILVGRVEALGIEEPPRRPLVYFANRYTRLKE